MEWNGKGLKIWKWIICNEVKVLFDETFVSLCVYVCCSNEKYIFSLWVKNIWKTLPYYCNSTIIFYWLKYLIGILKITPFLKLEVCSFTNVAYLALYPSGMPLYADTKSGESWGIFLKRGCHGYLPGLRTGNIGVAHIRIRSPAFSTSADVTYVLKEALSLPPQAPVLFPKENHDESSITRT